MSCESFAVFSSVFVRKQTEAGALQICPKATIFLAHAVTLTISSVTSKNIFSLISYGKLFYLYHTVYSHLGALTTANQLP